MAFGAGAGRQKAPHPYGTWGRCTWFHPTSPRNCPEMARGLVVVPNADQTGRLGARWRFAVRLAGGAERLRRGKGLAAGGPRLCAGGATRRVPVAAVVLYAVVGGRQWTRTTDLCDVNAAL
jgi:hypothetical protein